VHLAGSVGDNVQVVAGLEVMLLMLCLGRNTASLQPVLVYSWTVTHNQPGMVQQDIAVDETLCSRLLCWTHRDMLLVISGSSLCGRVVVLGSGAACFK
jgi:hypothetical protein